MYIVMNSSLDVRETGNSALCAKKCKHCNGCNPCTGEVREGVANIAVVAIFALGEVREEVANIAVVANLALGGSWGQSCKHCSGCKPYTRKI